MKLAVIILSCNQLKLTYALMDDIKRQDHDLDIIVVDNGGNYERQHNELIIKPADNLRWVKGVNLAFTYAQTTDASAVVCLNDDIRLSPGFFDGLRASLEANPEAGLVAPCYDDVHPQQLSEYEGQAANYQPIERDDEVSFVDGTAFILPMSDAIELGMLDAEHFGRYGWGSDIDLAYRVRMVLGKQVFVTHRAFINHFHQGSAKFVEYDWSGRAGQEMEEGMSAKYGDNWRDVVYAETLYMQMTDSGDAVEIYRPTRKKSYFSRLIEDIGRD